MDKPRRFVHDFDLVACVENSHEDFYNTPKEELIAAMRTRLANLRDDEIFDAFGLVNTSEFPNV
jgi:hypothetical protein